jgi:UDP-N-acetylglucosamine--N-acetylmuramyl-(pentapeptide) pyrophosphoryl-undecaprenol N-acetylglucosamine transferase
LVIEERELNGTRLADAMAALVSDPVKLGQMAVAARRLARPDAAARIADRVEVLAARRPRSGGRDAG